jgi:hypothetical protein
VPEENGEAARMPFLSHLIDHLYHVDLQRLSAASCEDRLAVPADSFQCLQAPLDVGVDLPFSLR